MRHFNLLVVTAIIASALPAVGMTASPIRVVVDGSSVLFDQPPAVVGGRVLVPLRGVFEKIGALVEWKPVTRTAIILRPGIYVQLRVGSTTASVNGAPVSLDVPAQLAGRRVLVPLRFVSEALGVFVVWRAADRTVVVSTMTAGPVQGKIDVATSASRYAVGQPIVVTIANATNVSIYTEDSKTDCTIVTLERQTASGWEAILGCRFGRTPLIVQIKAGARTSATVDPQSTHLSFGGGQLGFGAGTYRVKFSYSFARAVSGAEPEIVYSSEFPVR